MLSTALYERFFSRGEADYQNKLLSAMRFEFGGHLEKPAGEYDLHSCDRRDIACPLRRRTLYSMFQISAPLQFGESLEVHLDPLGDLSGDMFVAALPRLFPEHLPHVQSTIASLKSWRWSGMRARVASRSIPSPDVDCCRSGSHGAEPFGEPATARSPQRVFAQSRGKPPSRARSLSRESKRPQGVVRHSSRT